MTGLRYVGAAVMTIVIGLAVRRFLPASISKDLGDLLYATMAYWLVRGLRPNASRTKSMAAAMVFCFGIEILKLWHVAWLESFRATTTGHLIFGAVFSVSNLVCYIAGATLGFCIDQFLPAKGMLAP